MIKNEKKWKFTKKYTGSALVLWAAASVGNPHIQNILVLPWFCELPRVWGIPTLKIHWFCPGFVSCRECGESPHSKYVGSALVLWAAASVGNPHTQNTLVLPWFCELPRVWGIPTLKIHWFCPGLWAAASVGNPHTQNTVVLPCIQKSILSKIFDYLYLNWIIYEKYQMKYYSKLDLLCSEKMFIMTSFGTYVCEQHRNEKSESLQKLKI